MKTALDGIALAAPRCMLAAMSLLTVLGALRCQSSVRGWGNENFDTESRAGGIMQVSAGGNCTSLLRGDGKLFVEGVSWDGVCTPPPAPPGKQYVEVKVGHVMAVGLLSDGTMVQWGSLYPSRDPSVPVPIPGLPPGVRYTQTACGATHGVALRSDCALVAWGRNDKGQCNVPSLPPGETVVQLSTGGHHTLALLSSGSVVAWGDNSFGQLNVPVLPPGIHYVAVAAGAQHCLGLCSDGSIVPWGDNTYGNYNVPPLPAGTTYVKVSAGGTHSVALRSDNVIVPWGSAHYWIGSVPQVPSGLGVKQLVSGGAHLVVLFSDGTVAHWGRDRKDMPRQPPGQPPLQFVQVAGGDYFNLALLSDGSIVSWGLNQYGSAEIPAAVQGGHYLKIGAGDAHSVALRDDGQLLAWADQSLLPPYTYSILTSVPPLPPGLVYTDFCATIDRTVAIRSDGSVVSFGYNYVGVGNIPALPPGMSYIDVDAEYGRTVLLRSDGQIVTIGSFPQAMPALPQGLRYVQVATLDFWTGAIRSDGVAVFSPGLPSGPYYSFLPLEPPPWGVCYVEIVGAEDFMSLRRSDGQVSTMGWLGNAMRPIPRLENNTSYVELSSGAYTVTARVGPTSTYVSFAPGCPGSLPSARLIPRDTPRIGKTLEVTLFDLPQSVAFLVFGWQQLPSPVDLGFLGMPGCNLHISLDTIVPLVGTNQQARWELPIPNHASWVGTRFYNQALVLDPAAGNGFGAVVSDAAEAVIGNW